MKKVKKNQFNTDALDDLLVEEEKPRSHTMLPNGKQMSNNAEWDPFAVQYDDDDLFEKAKDAESSGEEDDHVNLDNLLDEPKISLESNKSNSKKNRSKKRSSKPMGEEVQSRKSDKGYNTYGEKDYDPYAVKNY